LLPLSQQLRSVGHWELTNDDVFWSRISKRNGAGEGTRTLDIQLGKLTLYQLSYARLDALAEGQFSHVRARGKNARSLSVHARARPPARLCPDRR
jgi:hypothetical protein